MRKIGLLALLSVILVEGAHASSRGNNNYLRGYRFGDDSGRVYSVSYSGIRNSNGDVTEVRINDHFRIGVLLFALRYDAPLPNNFPNRFIASEYFCQPTLAPIGGYNRYTAALTDDVYDAISEGSRNFRDVIRVYIDPIYNTIDIMIRNNRATLTEEETITMEMITNYLGHNIVESYPEYFRRRDDERSNTNNRPVPAEINTNNNIIVTAVTNPTDEHAEEEETESSTIANPAITALLFRLLMGGGSL